MTTPISKMWGLQIIGFALIALGVMLVYYPSLMHCARADQVTYLAEVANRQSWWDLAINTYNLNRHRMFCPGDELLFRPVIYFLLGTERFLFHYTFMGWQAVGIALHLGVIWFLLRLLLTIRCGLGALLATGCFALLYINMEMVIWQHINGYMIFMICLLIALRRWYLLWQGKGDAAKHVAVFVASVLLGVFTYEVMNIYAVLMIGLLGLLRRDIRKFLPVMLMPVGIYALASIADALIVKTASWEMERIVHESLNIGQSLYNVCWTLWFWFFTTVFAVQLPIDFYARNIIDPNVQAVVFNIQLNHPASLAALGCLGMLGFCLMLKQASDWRRQCPLLMMLIVMMVIYAAVIVVGRANSRGMWDILRVDLYYQYLFVLLSVILVFVAVDCVKGWPRFVKGVSIILLLLMVAPNAQQLWRANEQQAKENQPILVLVNTVEELIKQKSHEPDFSFFIADNYPGNYIYREIHHKMFPNRQYSFIEALYPQYFRREGAKYSFLTK